MSPLAFVNWRSVNVRFCVLMWVVAGVLAVVVLAHTGGTSVAIHHHASAALRR